MTPLIVIQARLGSTRLPGKVLLPLGDKPVLQHIVERCQRTGYPVVVAGTKNDIGQMPRLPCKSWWWDGAEGDVLGRYQSVLGATYHPDHRTLPTPDCLVRITADCPLVDPQLIEASVQAIRDGADYAGNTVERHWPRGCDVESFTTELLLKAHQTATDPYDREHVTPWMQRWASHPAALPLSIRPVGGFPHWRWCLDTEKDYRWLSGAFTQYGDPSLEQAAAYSLVQPPPLD